MIIIKLQTIDGWKEPSSPGPRYKKRKWLRAFVGAMEDGTTIRNRDIDNGWHGRVQVFGWHNDPDGLYLNY